MRAAAAGLGGALLAGGVGYLGFGIDRSDFTSLLAAFTTAFLGYVLIYRYGGRLRYWLALGLLLRVALVLAFPRLSDDIYRFIWDGRLITAGLNPFAELPSYYLLPGNEVVGLDAELFGRLNSPEYYTIYPPLAQFVFTVAAWLGGDSYVAVAVWIKLVLLLGEAGTLVLLLRLCEQFGLPGRRVLLYWLNPLIIVEIVGNLHFEGLMVVFLLGALYLLTRSRYVAAGVATALSIASKLLPLMLLPFLLRRLWRGPFWRFFVACGLALLGLFLPLLLGGGFLEGFSGSFDLYFRKFEFNASLYYLLRAYGYYDVGWNQIARYGPLLGLVAGSLIVIVALSDGRTDWRSLPGRWLAAFVIYLLCATTVHPWYLSVPVVLCVFTPWRFPLLWSYLIVLTYASYGSEPYREWLGLVVLEYSLVFAYYLWERYQKIKARASSAGPGL